VALEQTMPADVTWTAPRGGFFSWITLPGEADASVIAARARDERVAFVPGEPFFPDNRGRNNLRLSFSRVSEADIAEGARRLGALFRAATEEGKVSA
jgi:DNA-binding transcriptional MocR family regulator